MGAIKSERCSNGHLLSGDNLYLRKNGARECRQCSRDRSAKARGKSAGPKKPELRYEPLEGE